MATVDRLLLILVYVVFLACMLKVSSKVATVGGNFYRTFPKGLRPDFPFGYPGATKCMRSCLNQGYVCRGWMVTKEDLFCRLFLSKENLTDVDEKTKAALIPKPDKETFMQFERPITCRDVVCQNGGTCLDKTPDAISNAAFVCKCFCGTCGQFCETYNFLHIPRRGIAEKNIAEIDSTTLRECMDLCLYNGSCHSVDYGINNKMCYLNEFDHIQTKLHVFEDIDYYYPECKCPQK